MTTNKSGLVAWLSAKKTVLIMAPAIVLAGAIATNLIKPQLVGPATAATLAAPPAVLERPAGPVTLAQAPAPGGQFTPEQDAQIRAIIKDYLINNPEILMEMQTAFESKMEKVRGEQLKVALSENAKEIFQSPGTPIVGNPKGDVTVVEFFDYNCGYCKRALGDIAKLVQKDGNVKVAFKELPILSKGSEEAARVALASKAQGKYWEVHRALLEAKGQLNEATSLKIAEKAGLDMARLKKDMAGDEVQKEIDQVRDLAQKMGIQGTPHFLVGDRPIAGSPSDLLDQLNRNIAEIRKSGGCKVC